jgi:hypothetical protein
MKLTEDQRDDLLSKVADYADAYAYAYAYGPQRRRADCLACIVVVAERLMDEAYEAGKRDADLAALEK